MTILFMNGIDWYVKATVYFALLFTVLLFAYIYLYERGTGKTNP